MLLSVQRGELVFAVVLPSPLAAVVSLYSTARHGACTPRAYCITESLEGIQTVSLPSSIQR